MDKFAVTREQVLSALRAGKDWLLRNQILPETPSYDTFEITDAALKEGHWVDGPVPEHLRGGFYANLWRNPRGARRTDEVRRQYHSTWHSAQCAVALMDYLEVEADPAVRQAVERAWEFLRRHQVRQGEFAGVFVERDPKDLRLPLKDEYSFSQQNPKADCSYASYDNIETDLFPLELHRRWGNQEALESARANALFYLRRHPANVFFEIETHTRAISGMSNDAVYGRLAAQTGEEQFYAAFARQLKRLTLMGLDVRAKNNIRNMYWDMTTFVYALENCPEFHSLAAAKLAFIGEHVLSAQKPNGVLWFRFKEPGVIDMDYHERQDGAATYGTILAWGALYDLTGDPRWLRGIRKAVHHAVTHQYPATDHPGFAGAFEYAGWVDLEGRRSEMLRDISTAFAVRALAQLVIGDRRWTKAFWR